MNTKAKGDIAEHAVIFHALKRGWGVLKPLGDRLPYDLVLDVDGKLLKVQVKGAWFDSKRKNYVVDNRRTKTNRRRMVRAKYCEADFDFAIIYIQELEVFYVIPVSEFISYGSEVHLVETEKRQRKPKSEKFRNAWELILQGALPEEISG
ncbi:MAG TPA: group I intron-associated PD-(D/E)XK endonuclease [Chitinophagales bacterium]|nr:group I intron-associated PD-(D/E)XK endonuclease [Chitinophagales bacterium]